MQKGECSVKKLGFGLMRLPLKDAKNAASIDLDAVRPMVDLFMERGFTYYDTAYVYHNGASETAFREVVVKRYPRHAFTITDKLPMAIIHKAEEMEPIFQKSMQRLGVDYIDYYWLHALTRESYERAQRIGAFEFVRAKKDAGKVRHIGLSFHDSAEVLEQILNAHPEMEYVQLQLNYLDWEDEEVQARECYEVCVRHGKPVIVMEPLRGGALADVPAQVEQRFRACAPSASVPSWGIRFAASHEHVMMVLSGMSTLEQVRDNTGYMQDFIPMNEQEMCLAYEAGRKIRTTIAVPCTGCHYCDGCPQDISIPEYFSIYNEWKRMNFSKSEAMKKYRNLQRGLASACIACRQCETRCPQHIGIVDALQQVAQQLEEKYK